jgi:CDGSH-type Zn-finger protein
MKNKENKRRIKVMKDGPYIVTVSVPLVQEIMVMGSDGEPAGWKKGISYSDQGTYALCRCGASKNKPFCDGAHTKIGFDGTETVSHDHYLDQAERTSGPELDLTWSPKFCAVARFCHRAGDAWNLAERSNDPASKNTALREACDCPSGSLVAWDKNTGKPIEPDFEPSISLIENPQTNISGPIWAKGGIQIESSDGKEYESRNRVTLCRCGQSNNKPFCDGRHISIGFKSGS